MPSAVCVTSSPATNTTTDGGNNGCLPSSKVAVRQSSIIQCLPFTKSPPCVRQIRCCPESIGSRPPHTHFLDRVVDALGGLGRFVAGEGEDERHEGGEVVHKFVAGFCGEYG